MLKPLPESRWNFTTAAHLLNRAGFGGPPVEIERLVQLGPEKAVASLLDYENIPDPTPEPAWAKPDPERRAKLEALRQASEEERRRLLRQERQLQRERLVELRGWWLQRMAKGPRPLQEKMVLFWHGHFATSIEKVRDTYLMWRQNELFRRLATGNWLQLLVEVAKDPAMLIWLDQAQSRKQRPNENFAREVMELFALGEGHYTEKDVTEAARAFTGWSYDRLEQKFVERPAQHDDGVKTVLGKTGHLDGHDVLQQIVAQPQAARFITAKLWNFFAGQPPQPALNDALATVFRKHGNHFKPLLRVMFRSEEFYDPALIRAQVKSPVQWLVGTVRMLEMELPPAPVCGAILRQLGQELFAPPNVKGWDGGLTWITTNTLLARYNLAAALVMGQWAALGSPGARDNPQAPRRIENRLRQMRLAGPDVNRLLTEPERRDKNALIAALEKRLLQGELKDKQKAALREYLDSQGDLDEGDLLCAIRLVMSTPEYQLT
ncbi:MAG: DUF1800 domain-containing protein [Verrucomicrobiales bacterium]|nr:DUF1800 domain-containing protein [Verrucomicrobiales bacterium]